MAWLDDNGDDGEFSRVDEEPGGDGEDLSDEEEGLEEEVVVTERPSSVMPPSSGTVELGKSKAQTKSREKAKTKTKSRPAARVKKQPAKKARVKAPGGKRLARRKKR